MKIYDIDFSYPYDKFIKGMEQFRDDENYSSEIVISSSENTTRNGKCLYCFKVKHKTDGNETTIYFEKNPVNGDVLLVPISLKSLGETFYKVENLKDGTDAKDSTICLVLEYLENLAQETKGKIVCESKYGLECIINGERKSARKCIVDTDGNVYGAKEIEKISLDGISTESLYANYKTKLADWIKEKKLEDLNLATILSDQSTTLGQKYTLVGEYIMNLRIKDEITSDEFKDLIVQAGIADEYATNQLLNIIYKLLK